MTLRADVVVAGSGAIGSTIALRLARTGLGVVVADPAPTADNASGVAAGMLAPAFEALFDEKTRGQFALLRNARDLWPPLADGIGLPVERAGALAVGARSRVFDWAAALAGFGAEAQVLTPSETAAATPWLDGGWAVRSNEDWRLEPAIALRALRRAAERSRARWLPAGVVGRSNGQVLLADGTQVLAETLVLATGASDSLAALAPELDRISPIKGQILRASWPGPRGGPVLRGAGVYLCPTPGGLILGASMESGRGDREVDPRVVADLIDRAGSLSPGLRDLDWRAAAGVRGETPDGLPIVGPGSTAGVVLAVGARRNGWLLAPLLAEIVLARLEDRPPTPEGRMFDPARPALSPPG